MQPPGFRGTFDFMSRGQLTLFSGSAHPALAAEIGTRGLSLRSCRA
jgi:hypothetical protein